MRIGIVGASGFIGAAVAKAAARKGYEVIGFSRSEQKLTPPISEWRTSGASYDLRDLDVIINLAGDSIDQRWTDERKKSFHTSRVSVTESLVRSLKETRPEKRPKTLINGSAVGFYGDRKEELLKEDAGRGEGYLADLTVAWEKAAHGARHLGARVLFMRIGIVLGAEGSAYQKLLKVFKLGIGGRLGNGEQWMPWIHVDDLANAFVFLAEDEEISGPVNGTAPVPEKNKDFTRKLATSLDRPAFLPVPGFALKIVLGGFGGALLAGQRAVPALLEEKGFEFQYPYLEDALQALAKESA